eukprot:15484691-Alexandrium_andersonii.AAC.1
MLETNGYQKFSVGRKMQAQRLYDSLRRQGRETLRAFFARENMAVADLIREGVRLSAEQRAYQMLCRRGLSEDRITQVRAYVSAAHGAEH